MRWLTSVMRGADDFHVGDLVLVEQIDETPRVGRIDQLLQVVCADAVYTDVSQYTSFIRMSCSDATPVQLHDDGVISHAATAKSSSMLVRFELAQLTLVTCKGTSDAQIVMYQQ